MITVSYMWLYIAFCTIWDCLTSYFSGSRYSVMIEENNFVYLIHCFLTPCLCLPHCTCVFWTFVFQTKLSPQCWKVDKTVLCTRTKGWPVVVIVAVGVIDVMKTINTVICFVFCLFCLFFGCTGLYVIRSVDTEVRQDLFRLLKRNIEK